MKKQFNIEGFEVTTHNKREEALVKCLMHIIDSDKRYLAENTFGDSTRSIIRGYDMQRIYGLMTAMYYMDMGSNMHVNDLKFFKENHLIKN